MSVDEKILAGRIASWVATGLMAWFVFARARTMPGRFNAQLVASSTASFLAAWFYVSDPVRFWWIKTRPGNDVTDYIALVVGVYAAWTLVQATNAVKRCRQQSSGSENYRRPSEDRRGSDPMEARLPPDVQEELSRLVNERGASARSE